jgi:uncharacterized protein
MKERTTGRIAALDILRGLAVFGMLLVHVNVYTAPASGMGGAVERAIDVLVLGKAHTAFALLFGASFGLILLRADREGRPVTWAFLRRLAGIACFGVIAEGIFGYRVLIEYAACGVWLLVVRRWPPRALLAAVVVSASLSGLYHLAVPSEHRAPAVTISPSSAGRSGLKLSPERQAVEAALADEWAAAGNSFTRLVAYRMKLVYWNWGHVTWWPTWNGGRLDIGQLLRGAKDAPFVLFLVGLLAIKLGVFQRPLEHRGLILTAMAAGFASWVARQLWLPDLALMGRGAEDLALVYIGGVLLLVASSTSIAKWLTLFAAVGRLALSNYLAQVALLSLVFDGYGLGLRDLAPIPALAVAVAAFIGFALASQIWLTRFRYGPAEWVLRGLTYLHFPPLRQDTGAFAASPEVA